jgi:hypothetical protein
VVEQLEERQLLAVTYHGGALLPHVGVEAAFIGRYWDGQTGSQQASDLNNFLAYITDSSYMDMLGEYNVGRGSLVDNGIINDDVADRPTIDDSTIRRTLDNDIAKGYLHAPDANRLYIVFTAPNVDVTYQGQDSIQNFFGYHDSFTSSSGKPIYYAVIAHPIGNGDFYNLSDFQTLTKVVSHELAEGVTDPSGRGWYDRRTGDEIGDLSNGPDDLGFLNGYVVQAEWSQQQAASILPPDAQWVSSSSFATAQQTPGFAARKQVAYTFATSDEYFTTLIKNDYLQLLKRSPSAGEINGWVSLLRQGTTDEQVLAGFAGSAEYYQRAGGTDHAWLDALYHDLLGRAADDAGVSQWLQALASGTGRTSIAYGIATSTERESTVIAHDYQQFLDRAPTDSEVTSWIATFHNGMTNEQIVAGFVSSEESFERQNSSIEAWLTSAYQAILGRPSDRDGFANWDGFLERAAGGM